MPQFARRYSAVARIAIGLTAGLTLAVGLSACAPDTDATPTAGVDATAGFPRSITHDKGMAKFQANPLWQRLKAVQAGRVYEVKNESWMTSVSVQGAHFVLDDMAKTFGVDAAR